MTARERLDALAHEHGATVQASLFDGGLTVAVTDDRFLNIRVTRAWGDRDSAVDAALVALRTSLGLVGEDDPEAREEV